MVIYLARQRSPFISFCALLGSIPNLGQTASQTVDTKPASQARQRDRDPSSTICSTLTPMLDLWLVGWLVSVANWWMDIVSR